MKALKITVAILLPVAVVLSLLTFIYPIVAPVQLTETVDPLQKFIDAFGNLFSSLTEGIKIGLLLFVFAPFFAAVLFLLWLIFAIVTKRFIGILWGFVTLIFASALSTGGFLNWFWESNAGEEGTAYLIMQILGLVSLVLFIAAFVFGCISMFKSRKLQKAEQYEEVQEEQSTYEINYKDLPPVLFEESKPDHQPDIVAYHDDRICVGVNHVLKGHYVRDDEIDAILAAGNYRHEEEIPESILSFLDTKHEAEESGENLPMFDPNFVPTKEQAEMLTEEELFVLEALRRFAPKHEEEEVPASVHAFLESAPKEKKEEPVPESVLAFLNRKEEVKEEPVDERLQSFLERQPESEEQVDLPIFDPNFVPESETEEEPEEVSEEDKQIVEAMLRLEPEEKGPEYFGVSDEEYIDLPMFGEREEPVEIIEEFIRIEEPEEEVHAPKLAKANPVHVSKNKEGKYQLKQVGEDKPLKVFDSEEEALKYAEALKKVNGVSVRVHDEEGKIRSL